MEFLNLHKVDFDWNNDDLEDNKELIENLGVAHLEIPDEKPGINFESEQPVNSTLVEGVPLSYSKRAHDAAVNGILE